MNRSLRYRGFTLVELSIVIVIIAMLTAGVTAGVGMVRSAKLLSVINESTEYLSAVRSFKTQYNALPGDMPNAASYWSTSSGNGDGLVATGTAEPFLAWQHLSLSGFINGKYTAPGSPYNVSIGTNVPLSAYKITGATEWIYQVRPDYAAAWGFYLKEYLTHAGTTGNTNLDYAGISGVDAYRIDKKIDDANPAKGNVLTMRSAELTSTASRCVDTSDSGYAGGAVNYVRTDKVASCRMYFTFGQSY